jgi:thiosulfate reductase cytochrome b subunit
MTQNKSATKPKVTKSQHPLPVRVFHSLNIAAILLMASSGLQIYNATPVFGGKSGWTVPQLLTLGGWLAGGRHWHFAAMWLLWANLLIYFAYLVWSRRWQSRFANAADVKALVAEGTAGKRRTYAFHRILYSAVLPFVVLAILSGAAMYKPVQLDWLSSLAGSWQNLRVIHFITVPFVAIFIILHSWLGLQVGGWRLVRSIFWR